MAISLRIDETSGVQNSSTNESENNEVAYGVGVLPSAFQAVLDVVATGQGSPDVALSDDPNTVASSDYVVTFGPNVTDVAFTDSTGAALDGDYSGLRTTDGTRIFLYTYPQDNNILLGLKGNDNGTPDDPTDDYADPNGDVVFAAYLDQDSTGAKVWLVQYESIRHPDGSDPDDTVSPLANLINITVSATTTFSLTGAPSGQNLFLMWGDGSPAVGEVAIIATGQHPANQSEGASITTGDTVNTGQAGGGTTIGNTNQMLNEGEGLFFSFVNLSSASIPYTVPNLTQGGADVEGNILFDSYHGSTGASFALVQLQPGSEAATLKISAFNNTDATEKGTAYIDGLGDSDDVAVPINYLKATTYTKVGNSVVTAEYIFTADGTQGGMTVDFLDDGTVTVENVSTRTVFEYHTGSSHNRVLIENIGNTDPKKDADFDIGDFTLTDATRTTTAFNALAFDDDGPSATGTPATGTVDEDGLTGGIAGGTGDVTGEAVSATGSVSGIFQSGADTPLTYSIVASPTGLPSLTSKGGTVLYAVAGNTLTAYVDVDGIAGYLAGTDRAVFTFSITDTSTGAYTFTLLDQLDHAPLTGVAGDDTENDLVLNLGTAVQATDGDGDTVVAAAEKVAVTVDDDTPNALTPGDLTIANTAGTSGSAALGYINNVGADEPGSVVFVGGTDGDALQGAVQDGTPTLQNLTVGGSNIYLFGFGTSTLLATTNAADLTDSTSWVFRITLNPDGSVAANDVYNLDLYKAIANTVDVNFGSFTAHVSSGNPLTLVVENIGGSTVDALFSGFVDQSNNTTTQTTVNVSQAGVGVGTGQDFDFDPQTASSTDNLSDRMRIQFLEDDGDGVLETGEATTVNRFTFVVNQNNSPADDGDMLVRVYDAAGNEVQITGILVNGQTLVGAGAGQVASNDGGFVTATANGLGFELHGLGGGTAGNKADNDTVTIITTSGYQRIDISGIGNDANKDTFDILLQSVAVPTPYDITFSTQVQLTDYDGDSSAAASVDVTLDADGVFATLGSPSLEVA